MADLQKIDFSPMSAEAPTALHPLAPASPSHPSLESTERRRIRARSAWALKCVAVDAATLTAAAVGSMLGAAHGGLAWSFSWWTVAFAGVAVARLRTRGLYALRIRIPVLDDLRRIAGALTLAAMAVLALRVLVGASGGTVGTVRLWVFALVYMGAGRVALYWSESKARLAGESMRPALIVGSGRVATVLARRLKERPELGLDPIGFVDDDPLSEDELEFPVLGGSDDLERLVHQFAVEQVLVTFSHSSDESLLAIVNRAEALGLAVSVVPRLYEKVPERLTVEHLGGLALMTAQPADPKGWHYAVKYAIDRVAAAVLVLLAAPILLTCALAVRLTMGRPVFFRQPRVGVDGREFGMLKFRTMRGSPSTGGEADAAWLASQMSGAEVAAHVQVEDRRTPVGSFLRKASLDELPQLLNVLKGDMSLVGPRPERTSYVRQLERSIYRYGDRHRVKSGITGWAQVHGLRGDTSLADRVEWDNFYVENFSLWLDLKILLMTVRAVLSAENAK
jgi:exopolysaccharide biosynthesis polyprenyl glycosylphosphotransferase